jgi:hypothetical protein
MHSLPSYQSAYIYSICHRAERPESYQALKNTLRAKKIMSQEYTELLRLLKTV